MPIVQWTSFTHFILRFLLNTYYVLDTVLDTLVNKNRLRYCSHRGCILVENNQTNTCPVAHCAICEEGNL